MNDWYSSFVEGENNDREAERSAVLLAKVKYDEQLKSFVGQSEERLGFVRGEIDRIADETSAATGAQRDAVFHKLMKVIEADVIIPVSTPEHVELTNEEGSLPPEKNSDDVQEPTATTDVLDHGAVAEDAILDPPNHKIIPVQDGALKHGSCVRCATEDAIDESPVCAGCNLELVALAADRPPLSGSLSDKTSQPLAPTQQAPGQAPAPAAPTAQPVQPGVQPPAATAQPLNPNAPYQCVVCHFTGTWQAVSDHINTAVDSNHLRAKQNPPGVPAEGQVVAPQGQQVSAAIEDEPVEVGEENDISPSGKFKKLIQMMADRAAARDFSTIEEEEIQSIADTYGIDSDEVRDKVVAKATFGDYTAVNGNVGEADVPDGYTEVEVEGLGGMVDQHEAIVPTNAAVRKVAEDLGMDENNVYSSIKENMGADLSEEYHTTVNGQHNFYLPSDLAQNAPQDMQQSEQQMPPAPPAPQLSQPVAAKLAKDMRIQALRFERRAAELEAKGVEGIEEV